MIKHYLALTFAFALFCLAAGRYAFAAEESTNETVKTPKGIWAVQINVVDLDAALEFYTGTLKFEVLTRKAYPRVVPLKTGDPEGAHLLLFACDSLVSWDYDRQSKVNLNLYVENLDEYVTRFRAAGVTVLDDTALTAGVGKYVRILDPSGNQLDIMELGYDHEPVNKPAVYNVGALVTDMKASRKFYEGLLGFEVQSEKYYPPVIPYKVNGMQLVLHEGAEVTSSAVYPNSTQMLLTIITDNLEAHLARMKTAGFVALKEKHSKAPVGIYNAVHDPDGNVIELLEWKDNLFDRAKREE